MQRISKKKYTEEACSGPYRPYKSKLFDGFIMAELPDGNLEELFAQIITILIIISGQCQQPPPIGMSIKESITYQSVMAIPNQSALVPFLITSIWTFVFYVGDCFLPQLSRVTETPFVALLSINVP